MNLYEIMKMADPQHIDCLEVYIKNHSPEFLKILLECPLRPNQCNVSLSEAFWLYRLSKELQPELIVESGTMDGYSAWWLRQGSLGAKLCTFDPNRAPRIDLGNHTHYTADFPADLQDIYCQQLPEKTLVFFDDHQDQNARLLTSINLGIKHIVFHDVYPRFYYGGEFHTLWESSPPNEARLWFYQFLPIRTPNSLFRKPEFSGHRWLTYVGVAE